MAITELCSKINKDITYYQVSAPYNSGQIIIDVDEEKLTDKMKRALAGILFTIYIKLEDSEQYIPVEGRSYIWSSKADLSMPIYEIPEDFYFGIQPIVDSYYDIREFLSASDTTYSSSVKYYIRTGKGTVPDPFVYTFDSHITEDNFDELKNKLYVVDASIDYDEFPIAVLFDSSSQSSGVGSTDKLLGAGVIT